MLQSEPLGVGSGSGGPLESGHVICPACAHNFAAIPPNARERIAALEEALAEAVEEWASALNVMPNVRSRRRLDEVRALIER